MKVLIVDDVQFMVVSLKRLLERNGYEVATALNGIEALKFLSTDFTIDVVITDFVMPEMSGLELYQHAQIIERVNDQGTVPPPPFVLLTSFEKANSSSAFDSAFQEAQRCFVDILHKPIEEAELLPLLENLKNQGTGVSGEGALLRKILQDSINQLGQSSSQENETAVAQKLLHSLQEYQARFVTSDAL